MGRFVEAELFLQALDELRIEPLRPAVFRRSALICGRLALSLAGAAKVAPSRAANPCRGPHIGACELGDDPFNRTARCKLDDHKAHQHDAEQGRDHQQQSSENIGAHRRLVPGGFQFGRFVFIVPPCGDNSAAKPWLCFGSGKLVPIGHVMG